MGRLAYERNATWRGTPIAPISCMAESVNDSVWAPGLADSFAPLDRDLDVDVLVVGGGLTGLTATYLLARAGIRVALLERRRVMSGDTRLTTAHVTPVTDARAHELARLAGESHAGAVWSAGRAALRQMQRIVEDHGIDCGWAAVSGFLHVPFDAPAEDDRNELDSLEQDATLAAGWGENAQVMGAVPLMQRPGVHFQDQRVLDPARYLQGVTAAAVAAGAMIYEHSEPAFTTDEHVECRGHRIRAGWIVMATHNPHAGRQSAAAASLLQTRLALYTTFVVRATTTAPVAPGLYWDTGDPYRYLRVDPATDGRSLIAGGGDSKTGQQEDAREQAAAIERWLNALVPDAQVTHRWSGQVIETPDGIPFIGEVADRQWIATGYAGNGMTFGTLAAMMVCDGVLGRANPWREVVSPERATLRRAPWEYIRENLDYPYYMLRRVLGADAGAALRALAPGEAAVLQLNGQAVAAARTEAGRLHLRSAICTHMGCTVRWNHLARSWDCPCHGSRFKVDGEVLGGPAERPLAPPG
jgi:glycine/D-amino acid oxidase-like deaminating enzyme/nitrite reductase/ring-hydroxylating ferredoxin subunit